MEDFKLHANQAAAIEMNANRCLSPVFFSYYFHKTDL